jgi:Zn-dependent peptidase ImmA (M78 family)
MTKLTVVQTKADLARLALGAALKVRQNANIPLNEPLSIYDLCSAMGIEVQFVNISMEGNYIPGQKPRFLISALRPAVRRAFTCAHELGHHVFGHGFMLDELVEHRESQNKPPEEFIADCFASSLLMPAQGIRKALAQRNWKAVELTPEQIYTIACDFGVGYETLVTHLSAGMKLIDFGQSQELKKSKLPTIRQSFVGRLEIPRRLIVTDQQSLSSIIECEVGDHVLVDAAVSPQNDSLHTLPPIDGKQLFVAARRGVTSLRTADGKTFQQVRIMAHQFVGLNRYLYLPDPDEDNEL